MWELVSEEATLSWPELQPLESPLLCRVPLFILSRRSCSSAEWRSGSGTFGLFGVGSRPVGNTGLMSSMFLYLK